MTDFAGPLDALALMSDLQGILGAADLTPSESDLIQAFRATGEWPEAAKELGISLPAMRKRKERLLEKLAPR